MGLSQSFTVLHFKWVRFNKPQVRLSKEISGGESCQRPSGTGTVHHEEW